MTSSHSFDAFIVGAGPAGVTCAITLAQAGINVGICDKGSPGNKPCGEGIMPPGVVILKKLGILKNIQPSLMHHISGIEYNMNGICAQAKFQEGLGLGINRETLKNALYQALKQYPNIKTFHSCSYLSSKEPGTKVCLKQKENHFQINCKILIGADGIRSNVRRDMAISLKPRKNNRWAIRCHYDVKPWSSNVLISVGPGVECYITPTGNREINVVFIWQTDKMKGFKGPDGTFDHMLNFFPHIKKKLLSHKPKERPRAIGPFGIFPLKLVKGNNYALIGDAAGYHDPLTGEGISLGMTSGMILAHNIRDNLKKGQITTKDLSLYEKQYFNKAFGHKVITHAMMFLTARQNLFSHALNFLKLRPQYLSLLMSLNMGTKPTFLAQSTNT